MGVTQVVQTASGAVRLLKSSYDAAKGFRQTQDRAKKRGDEFPTIIFDIANAPSFARRSKGLADLKQFLETHEEFLERAPNLRFYRKWLQGRPTLLIAAPAGTQWDSRATAELFQDLRTLRT